MGNQLGKNTFNDYLWDRCAIGTQSQGAVANTYQKWINAMSGGRLWDRCSQSSELMFLAPANNTDYNNVSAYLEAFWGYIWPAINHGILDQLQRSLLLPPFIRHCSTG